jgi:hypothetical protein
LRPLAAHGARRGLRAGARHHGRRCGDLGRDSLTPALI